MQQQGYLRHLGAAAWPAATPFKAASALTLPGIASLPTTPRHISPTSAAAAEIHNHLFPLFGDCHLIKPFSRSIFKSWRRPPAVDRERKLITRQQVKRGNDNYDNKKRGKKGRRTGVDWEGKGNAARTGGRLEKGAESE